MSAGTQAKLVDTAFVDETYDPTDTPEPEATSADRQSPYVARAMARIEAERDGRPLEQPKARIPPWRHDGLAPNWGDGQ